MSLNSDELIFYSKNDAPEKGLKGEQIVILGYGHLGQPFALNMRDSGVNPIIGNIDDVYAQGATNDGFKVLSIPDAVELGTIIYILLSDEIIPSVFANDISPNLPSRSAIVFASGYTLAYKLIDPPKNVDILLLAPRMAGENARQKYINGQGFFAYLSVEQDVSGVAEERLLGLADSVGILDGGAMVLDAKREADIDLLIEQTVGAVLGVSLLTAFALGEEKGIPPEALVLEMYMSGEMEMVWRSFREEGLFIASSVHGPTALYGGFIRTMQFMQSDLSGLFREILDDIMNGGFAKKFQAERDAGYPMLKQAEAMSSSDSPLSAAEDRVRKYLMKE